MAIDDPRAVKFCNERLRPASDTLARGYTTGSGLLSLWQLQNIASLIVNDASQIVADGSPADGRPTLNGQQANMVIEALTAFKAAMDATASNGKTHLQNVMEVAPNPTPATQIGI